jgi:ornithine racemase
MPYPRIEIDLKKLEENASAEIALLAGWGVSVMGVNKVFNGMREPAEALVRAGIQVIAESRIGNLRKLEGLSCRKCLLRIPSLSEIPEVIRYADISLNSEIPVLRALSQEAQRQGRLHEVMILVDMGDLREGIWFEDKKQLRAVLEEVRELPGLRLYGLGTNFNCYGSLLPTRENGEEFVRLAREMEAELSLRIPVLSGGSSTSFCLIDRKTWPEGINELRIGGIHLYGLEYVAPRYLEGFHHSAMDVNRLCSPLYKLKAEIIEISVKPSVPRGELGLDAFQQRKTFVDRGKRKRAVLAFGRQDIPSSNCWPVDESLLVLGQSSDHTLVDIHDATREYRVGDLLEFELDYTALMHGCNSPGIEKVVV